MNRRTSLKAARITSMLAACLATAAIAHATSDQPGQVRRDTYPAASAASAAVAVAAATRTQATPRPMPTPTGEGWTNLFNGTDTSGWTTWGESDAWAAVDGELRAVKPGRGWWLRTTRMYRDFELSLEFVLPPGGNSGIGIRGSNNGDPAFTGFEVQVFDSHGTPISDNVCGAVYNAIPPREQACKPAGEWNTYHITMVGDTLNVWLNGVHIHIDEKLDERGYVHSKDNPSPLNARLTTGYIALQDHGDAVRYRNIKLKDLSPDPDHDGYTQLITPDLSGWVKRGGGTWTVEDGTLVGKDGPGHLFTERKVKNFELRGLVRVNERGNSGIYFRVEPRTEDPNSWPAGYEAQIDNHDMKNYTGSLYNRALATSLITRDNAWFDYRIRCDGERIQTWINGVPMVDTVQTDFHTGSIALQAHHVGSRIEFRDLRYWQLPDNMKD